MDKRLSVKISLVSFLLLLHVVVGHSVTIAYDPDAGFGIHNTVWFIQNFISSRLVKVIIPLFFFISAYLFFLNITPGVNDGAATFREKIGKRLKTLGIPYLFWSTFWFVVLYVMQSIPQLDAFFPTKFRDMSLWKQFWNLYVEPVNYPFWFLRELLLYVILTPVFYWLVRRFRLWPSAVFFTVSLFVFAIHVADIDIYRFHMMAYYCLGIFCAINKTDLSLRLNGWIQFALVLVGFGLCALLIFFDIWHFDSQSWPVRLIDNLTTVIGFVSYWSLYDYLDERFNFRYRPVFAYGFIIYAVHGLPILWLKEALVKFFQPTPLLALVFYVCSFTTIIAASLVFGMTLRKLFPKLYSFTTGNR